VLAKRHPFCQLAVMSSKALPILMAISLLAALPAGAQTPSANPADSNKTEDSPQANRFWQATLPGGHYMVALDRISAISRHKYVLLDGSAIVDEVTIDALGQALARFYYIAPVTDAATGTHTGELAKRIAGRAGELIDKAADTAGTTAHQMVIKKFPETTHAHTIEYRLLSAEELTGLYSSIRASWENGRGRKFTVK
jgi:hypothetical protein